jgi:hypothetical protein
MGDGIRLWRPLVRRLVAGEPSDYSWFEIGCRSRSSRIERLGAGLVWRTRGWLRLPWPKQRDSGGRTMGG